MLKMTNGHIKEIFNVCLQTHCLYNAGQIQVVTLPTKLKYRNQVQL